MKSILAIMLLSLCCYAQSSKKSPDLTTGNWTAQTIQFNNEPQPRVSLGGTYIIEVDDKDGKLMVRVERSGKVSFGKGYEADASAKTFWEVLAKYYPIVCEKPVPLEKK